MKFTSFLRWTHRDGQHSRRSPRRKKLRPAARRPCVLTVEGLEDRTLLSVLPPAVVTGQTDISGADTIPPSNKNTPTIVYDPLHPQTLVTVYSENFGVHVGGPNGPISLVVGAVSTDGGLSWTRFNMPNLLNDPNAPTNNPHQFYYATDPSVAFDRNHNIYIVYNEESDVSLAGRTASGAVVFQKFNVSSGFPTQVIRDRVLYQWLGQDPALNPVITVDNNLPMFLDPDTTLSTAQRTQSDPFSGTAYVAWNTNNTAPQNFGINPNAIKLMASADGGFNWSTQVYVNDSQNNATPGDRNATPQLAVSQGTANGRVPGGQLSITWNDFARNQIMMDRVLDGGVGYDFTNSVGGTINDAVAGTNGAPDKKVTSTFDIPVSINDPNFRISDLNVSLSLTDPNLQGLSIVLEAPDGTMITLVNNGLDESGNNLRRGIAGNTMGFGATGEVNPGKGGTVFDDAAPRAITDPSAAQPFTAHFQPEGDGSGVDLSVFNGQQPLNNTWHLLITTFRHQNANGVLRDWSLTFTGHLTTNADTVVGDGAHNLPIASGAPLEPFVGAANFLPDPSIGVAAMPVIAFDNTLGAYSPYQGRLYAAYTGGSGNNTNVYLTHSDDNGRTWSRPVQVNDDNAFDGFSAGNRNQFEPSLAVDPVTGTVVVSFYDSRHDAANARVATFIATSIDGGNTFATEVYANPSRTAIDAVTGQTVNLEPIPDNQSTGNPNRDTTFGFGNHQGLAVYGGNVYPVWSGNQNGGGTLHIYTAKHTLPGNVAAGGAAIAAGPRIVDSTMGPVDDATINQLLTSAHPQLSFDVTFDRPVDPATFTRDQVQVFFRDPNLPDSSPAIPLDLIGNPTPLDAGAFGPAGAQGATEFEVDFDPTKALTMRGTFTGTYSYSVGPNISDRIRRQVIGTSGGGVSIGTRTATDTPLDIPIDANTSSPPDTGGPNSPHTQSKIVINNVAAGQVITHVAVHVRIDHTFDSDMVITLIGPNNAQYILSNREGFDGHNFGTGTGISTVYTTFDDLAGTPISAGFAPFVGSFQPDQSLSTLNGISPNGTWTLDIQDVAAQDIGKLLSWTLDVSVATAGANTINGNQMDQNANTITGEANTDVYAVPRPIDGIPFQLPYDQNTLPIIVPGPHPVRTFVPGNKDSSGNLIDSTTGDHTNLVLNGTVNAIDVVFDRDMSSFPSSQVVRMMGPAGLISGPFTVTPDPNGDPNNPDPDPSHPRTWRISGFPTQFLSGTYTIIFGPNVLAKNGEAMDVNLNAGLDVLRGGSPQNAQLVPITVGATPGAVTIGPGKTVTSTLTFTDPFLIEGATLQLNILDTNDPDLSATLIAPDGTPIRLFTSVGNRGSKANFLQTIFDDNANTPISQGFPPFNGSFNPQDPLSRLIGKGSTSPTGTWTLQISNASATNTATLVGKNPGDPPWSLTLTKSVAGTGLGELSADQATASFRIFTMDNNNALSHQVWTPVGPASENSGGNSGRIGGLALDPSDPSGNTVYVAGASGGIWKTTNFLTTDPAGPTYIPLTDFGPTFAINIGGLAVFNTGTDPTKSVIIAATGEGDTSTRGVGFLRSTDGGATWSVLDSTTNVDSSGNVLPINSPQRDHKFVGNSSFKVIVDPHAGPTGPHNVIIYAAMTGAHGGIWQSFDEGDHWVQDLAGNATDVVLAPGSTTASSPNAQVVYAAFRNDPNGVYVSKNEGSSWAPMVGKVGVPLIQQPDGTSISVAPPPSDPTGGKGRIVLATPALTNDRVKNLIYEGWLYAAAVASNGSLDGLYLTKDFGDNWTKVRLSYTGDRRMSPPKIGVPTNDDSNPATDYDPLSDSTGAQGLYDISLAIDPNNPNVVYLGGTSDFSPYGMIRVDTTGIIDPHAIVSWDNSDPDGGLLQTSTTGSAVSTSATNPPPAGVLTATGSAPYLNVVRDPNDIFNSGATVFTQGVTNLTNEGTGITWLPFTDILSGSTDQHRLLTFTDPLTGHTRLIVGDDQGVFTGVDDGTGNLTGGIGTAQAVTGPRNGNLQIIQFYYGAAQPSYGPGLANEIGGALFYGNAQDDGFPVSDPHILDNGNIGWNGPAGDGTGIATDQTGSGNLYTYQWPCCGVHQTPDGHPARTDFFGVNDAGQYNPTTGFFNSRTNGLFADGLAQWPKLGGSNFAVNPVNGDFILISSQQGRVFSTNNQGLLWSKVGFNSGDPGANTGNTLDGSYAPALAFGALDPANPRGTLDQFLYAGTTAGHIFVTSNGGNTWTQFGTAQGLDGNPVQAIITNPLHGSHEAFAVTTGGVFYIADSLATGATWTNITGNLFSLTHGIFGSSTNTDSILGSTATGGSYLTSIVADWRFALPDNAGSALPTHPVLYVGGEGGVFRSTDKGTTWTVFPDVADDGAPVNGGYLPVAHVTDLDLSLGNINPDTGLWNHNGSPDLLIATTYGRGTFAIRVAPPLHALGVPNLTATEGKQMPTTTVATFADPLPAGSNPTFTATIDWGDNTATDTVTPSFSNGNGTVQGSHTYLEEGKYTVTVVISDNTGNTVTTKSAIQVADAALHATGPATSIPVLLGQKLTNALVAHFTDDDPNGTLSDYSASVTWADNTSGTVTHTVTTAGGSVRIVANSGGGFDVFADNANAYTAEGDYNFTVVIQDVGSSTATVNGKVHVSAVQATGQSNIAGAVEGHRLTNALVATFIDVISRGRPADYTATVTWDDGGGKSHTGSSTGINPTVRIRLNGDGSYSVFADNTVPYADEGTYNITVLVAKKGTSSNSTAMSTALVGDATLVRQGLPRTVHPLTNTSFTGVVASFRDRFAKAPRTDFNTPPGSVSIDWGDGNTSVGTVVRNPNHGFNVKGTNTYAAKGTYTITVTITDEGGSPLTLTGTAVVKDGVVIVPGTRTMAALAISPGLEPGLEPGAAVSFSALAGVAFSHLVATFRDPGLNRPASAFSATVDWGDHSLSAGRVTRTADGAYHVAGSHTYAKAGKYTITVTVLDGSGSPLTLEAEADVVRGISIVL
jgi:subtilisin-like proprotein convertase family protein